jgi:uncharacterized membrane protein
MSRTEFLEQLRRELAGLSAAEIADIVFDYNAHFDEAVAAGRSEDEVARALGDPTRLSRELRTETKLRRWEKQRTPSALVGAIAALGGMIAIDILILLPFLLVLGFVVFILAIVLFSFGAAGFGVMTKALLHWRDFDASSYAIARILAGIGFFAGSVGSAALLWLVLEKLVVLLGSYVRLHYRLLKAQHVSDAP